MKSPHGSYIKLAILFALWFTSIPGRAAGLSRPCAGLDGDPYDRGWTMPAGVFKGQCLENERKRPVEILSEDRGDLKFANFYYEGKWWTARIPANAKVEQVIFHIDRFNSVIPGLIPAHTQLRFKLSSDAPIELTAQRPGQEPSHATVSDVVYSVEAVWIPGKKFDIIQGQFDKFAIVGRLMSTWDRASEEMEGGRDIIEQYKLNVSPEDGMRVLRNAVNRSQEMGLSNMYNTLGDNCTTEAFDILDRALAYGKKVPRFRMSLWHPMDSIAGPSLRALTMRGLIGPASEIPTINTEVAARNANPCTEAILTALSPIR